MDDAAMLATLLHNLVPIIGMLAFGSIPIGIIWVLKSHKLRMRELDIEEKTMLSRGAEARLAALEQRLAALEAAASGGQLPGPVEQRARLLESPPSETPTKPEALRVKQR